MCAASNVNMLECNNELKPEGKSEENKSPDTEKPLCVIVIGMAGSGKTTFVQVCSPKIIVLNQSIRYWKV